MISFFRSAKLCVVSALAIEAATMQLSATVPSNAAPPVQSSFISLAVEFFLFPYLSGSSSSPNTLSQNLIANLGKLQSATPILRVGGTSQDHALYNKSLPLSTPTVKVGNGPAIRFGPGFFDAFKGLPNVEFTFGLNLAGNDSAAAASLQAVAKLICQQLGNSLAYWELGNEPDLFTRSDANHNFRPPSWKENDYVKEWLNKSSAITSAVQSVSPSCPNLLNNGKLSFVAPSFFNVIDHLDPVKTWDAGLGNNGNINELTGHIYIDSQDNNAVTLQGTLMNHTRTSIEINNRMDVWNQVAQRSKDYFSFNEIGSLVPIGKHNISDVFGASLWTFDFALHAARRGVGRLHWQQGRGFPYESWEATGTPDITKGTKPPYYGLIASASFIGNSVQDQVRVIELGVSDPVQTSSYALYRNGTLDSIAIVQMTLYTGGSSAQRPRTTFTYQLPNGYANRVINAQWLAGPGGYASTGITFAGLTYDTADGTPASQPPVSNGVGNFSVTSSGLLTVNLPYSSAVILHIHP